MNDSRLNPRRKMHHSNTHQSSGKKNKAALSKKSAVTESPGRGVFKDLLPEIQQALADEGYTEPTPIQEQSIAPLLAGRDLLGSAQTGTGKTAAFSLPILQNITRKPEKALRGKPRVLILAPTRELAAQIGQSIATYGRHLGIRHAVIFGGVNQNPQVKSLNQGRDIVVATPGRLLDLMNQGHIRLDAVEIFVLDEADRMLDMGFLPDIRKVIRKLPSKRQNLFFSATLIPEVMTLARSIVHDPVEVAIEPDKPAVEKIVQKVFFVDQKKKTSLLVDLLKQKNLSRVLVFTKMKYRANRVAEKLNASRIRSAAIHGNKAQNARNRALDDFKKGTVRVLVATDIAARGLDVDRITHVINYDLPTEPETYVHRIGRTARAGTDGDAVSFCSAEEKALLNSIEKLIGKQVPQEHDHAYHSPAAQSATRKSAPSGSRKKGRQRQTSRQSQTKKTDRPFSKKKKKNR